jgi:predicted amino acid dehydrogenase
MDNFAFVIHPVDPKRDVARKYPRLARVLPTRLVHFLARFWPPVYLSHVTGVRSESAGKEIEGWLVACPFTARQALELPTRTVYNKIIAAGRLAQRMGAQILGLGAFTSVVGDAGMTVARYLDIPVTTGHSFTVAMAVEALEAGARCRDVRLDSSTVAVIGATGSIGRACAEVLAPRVGGLVLIGRSESRLAQVQSWVREAGARRVHASLQVEEIGEADLVLSATSAADSVILPEQLKHGAVVCDIALPPDVSPRVKRERNDVLAVAGGVVDVPGEVDFGFDFGLSPGKAYACMAETMILALDGRYESYSLGKHVQIERVREIARLARKHGFRLSAIC